MWWSARSRLPDQTESRVGALISLPNQKNLCRPSEKHNVSKQCFLWNLDAVPTCNFLTVGVFICETRRGLSLPNNVSLLLQLRKNTPRH